MKRLCLLFLLIAVSLSRAASPSLVVIDAGHGGRDSGAKANGLVEKELTLDTARRLEARLRKAKIKTVMLRTRDEFIDLDDRVRFANRYIGKNAVLVSIHFNAVGGSSARGLETFFWKPEATALAVRVQNNVAKKTGLANVGVNRRRLRLTRNPEIPSILVEAGFLTNRTEARFLAKPHGRDAVAQGIAAGIFELRQKGEKGIRRVPYIASSLSRKTDPKEGGQRMRPGH